MALCRHQPFRVRMSWHRPRLGVCDGCGWHEVTRRHGLRWLCSDCSSLRPGLYSAAVDLQLEEGNRTQPSNADAPVVPLFHWPRKTEWFSDGGAA